MKKWFYLLFIFCSMTAFADKFEQDASYRVCFTPSENCTNQIVATINQGKKQIRVQAYSFTSVPIAKALIQAYKRGVDVKMILDKSQFREKGFSSAKLFSDYRIPVQIDYRPSIAHNKVMIIDGKTVITGSFNYTKAAEEHNAENVIIISDSELAKKYLNNWDQRAAESEVLSNSNSSFQ